MNDLLQIIVNTNLQESEASGYNHFWNVIKDFVIPIGIALFAAWGAYQIFVLESRRDNRKDQERKDQEKQKEQEEKDEERNEKLLYFASLIKSCLELSISLKNNLKEYIRKIKMLINPIPPMGLRASNDLIRVAENMDLENYMLAFTHRFSAEKKESLVKFRKIIGCVDYFNFMYKQIKDKTIDFNNRHYERQIKFFDYYKQGFPLTNQISMILQIHNAESEAYKEFSIIATKYTEMNKSKELDHIEFIQKYFNIPYNDFCKRYLRFIDQVGRSELSQLEVITMDGIKMYEEIHYEFGAYKERLFIDYKIMLKQISVFQNNAKLLIEDIT